MNIRDTMKALAAEAIMQGIDLSTMEYRMSPAAFGELVKTYGDTIPADLMDVRSTFMGIDVNTSDGHPPTGNVQLCSVDHPRHGTQLRIE